jgi:peptide/nickel transport system ATP-binding protein
MAILELVGVAVEYQRKGRVRVRAVDGVDLALAEGEILGLVGESGCGKSSLARAIVGLTRVAEGEIRFKKQPVRPLRFRRRLSEQLGLQMIFQESYASLNPRRTVAAQLADGLRAQGEASGDSPVALLERVGLPAEAASRFPHEFSGGQRQRIAIARTLAARPAVIIADEPVAALDASNQAQVANLLVSLCREASVALLFISHDLALVHHLADRLAVMYLGRIVEVAPASALWASPRHPYTQALIEAIPTADGRRMVPEGLAGEVPDPARPPEGCRLRPRCRYAVEACLAPPPLKAVAVAHEAACWRAEELELTGAGTAA